MSDTHTVSEHTDAGVRDNPQKSRYELEQDGATAAAHYRISGDVITFTHTEVPDALHGRGVGSKLVHGALENTRERKLKVVPRCSFVAAYIDRHREFADLVAG
ncbi:hypothetical protein A33M_0225 [Rhodovulum sp. PH10]|uniref:GNAT family N-acetyltransferase n=1 Tax=Rhodovulum sp. PH10 TaxID=1187851 RepID=UPI00027C2254|nr:GNAT family N-acetyltransferase [Rhodovulum sp. PH10]EJW10288.1 hypothetical protein A33M_0225 [Rhodovulum sp. PH10]